ncbi:hypothetical protein [Candidatus Nitrosotenuis chungbukensis]|uniref:hypothetical protein n=1 Tax=Candidatus Nitrosotenuis chungbukensis TaxID=1353246 RepID=UPI0005B2E588|nr:hypothetical protein [Candidatus Nitrosotenuis chungbukensis]
MSFLKNNLQKTFSDQDQKIIFNRRLHNKKEQKMTLIIGFKCAEGVCLVSDTRITNLETQEFEYESKVLTPLQNTPFIAGAAGYTRLFREFNRKLPDKVSTRFNEVQLKNLRALIDSGLSRKEAVERLYPKTNTEQQKQEISQGEKDSDQVPEESQYDVPLTYSYSSEDFIDDCKGLIKEISKQVEDDPQAIEVLIGLKRRDGESPSLHFIDSQGNEEEIDTFYPIGSGSPYVRMFFNKLYDYDKTIMELITQAFRTIVYTSNIALEASVGYTNEHPIEAYTVLNNGAAGIIRFKNELEVISNLESEMRGEFEVLIKNSRVKPLEWAEP